MESLTRELAYTFFCQPKLVAGSCALENTPAELASNDSYKPLVITSKTVTGGRLHKHLIKAFYDSGCPIGGIFDEVRNYAGVGLARQAALLAEERGCDAFIALGSGPVADVARAANILAARQTEDRTEDRTDDRTDDLFACFEGNCLKKRLLPLILIPSGCLTGMESGRTLTIDNRELSSDFLYPDVVILDKRMTKPASRREFAESAAMTADNAAGAFMDPEYSPMKEAFAHAGLQLLADSFPKPDRRAGDKKRHLATANAAVLAGIAAANARPGLVRLLSQELEKTTHIARGVFTALLAPAAFTWLAEQNGTPREELLLAVAGMDAYAATAPENRAVESLERLDTLFLEIRKDIPESLAGLQIPAYKLEQACQNAASNKAAWFSAQDAGAVLERAQKGNAKKGDR